VALAIFLVSLGLCISGEEEKRRKLRERGEA